MGTRHRGFSQRGCKRSPGRYVLDTASRRLAVQEIAASKRHRAAAPMSSLHLFPHAGQELSAKNKDLVQEKYSCYEIRTS